MSLFELPDFDQHEQVVFVSDRDSGLRAIIAIHHTGRGPAMGGCRMWPYADSVTAATDALRLSRGMTYKNAMAGLPIGGGKAVIIGDSKTAKTPALFAALGKAIDQLGGRYITAEDVGTSPADMQSVHQRTRFVAGLEGEPGRGDPSPATALGVRVGIEAAVQHQLGVDRLQGLTVAIQGLGHVGFDLARQLHEAGARLIVADIDPSRTQRAAEAFGARISSVDDIVAAEAEVFAPCALGAVINPSSLPRLRCKVVAGAANNQLATDDLGEQLREAGILYAPDYVINAGGIIKVCAEYYREPADSVEGRVLAIKQTLAEVFATADRQGISTRLAADRMAEARFS